MCGEFLIRARYTLDCFSRALRTCFYGCVTVCIYSSILTPDTRLRTISISREMPACGRKQFVKYFTVYNKVSFLFQVSCLEFNAAGAEYTRLFLYKLQMRILFFSTREIGYNFIVIIMPRGRHFARVYEIPAVFFDEH